MIVPNPYAVGGLFCQYKMMQNPSKMTETMGTHLRVLSESFPMNTHMTGFRCFFRNLCLLSFGRK